MTDEQVNRIVQHLCEQLHVAVRLKGTGVFPSNAKDLGFDAPTVKTILLSGVRSAGDHNSTGTRDWRGAAVVLSEKRGNLSSRPVVLTADKDQLRDAARRLLDSGQLSTAALSRVPAESKSEASASTRKRRIWRPISLGLAILAASLLIGIATYQTKTGHPTQFSK
jgi:hypothetical protein